jgi:hypothetical protein
VDARTRKLAGLAIAAVGVVVAVVGGLADQIGIGANDEGEMGGKQIAALVVGVLLVIGGIVLATVLAKDDAGGGRAEPADAAPAPAVDAASADTTATPAAGTPVVDAEPADAEPVEAATDSSD